MSQDWEKSIKSLNLNPRDQRLTFLSREGYHFVKWNQYLILIISFNLKINRYHKSMNLEAKWKFDICVTNKNNNKQ